jgi:ribosomal protein S27E
MNVIKCPDCKGGNYRYDPRLNEYTCTSCWCRWKQPDTVTIPRAEYEAMLKALEGAVNITCETCGYTVRDCYKAYTAARAQEAHGG